MSNNANQPDKTGGYREKVSKKSESVSYSDESRKENDINLHLRTNLLTGRGTGILPSIIILMIFIGVFVFVLPKMDMFNHVIKPTDYVSGADIPDYIRKGATGEEVISLQRALFKLGAVTIDDITGVYDDTSSKAVNSVLSEHSMATGDNCSLKGYQYIVALSEGGVVISGSDKDAGSASDKDKPEEDKDKGKDKDKDKDKDSEDGKTEKTEKTKENEKTTTAASKTTTTTSAKESEKTTVKTSSTKTEEDENEEGKKKIRITEDAVRLYAKMRRSSTILFYVEEGDEYELLETVTDDDGNTWYKIQYKDICTGWIVGEKAEVIS